MPYALTWIVLVIERLKFDKKKKSSTLFAKSQVSAMDGQVREGKRGRRASALGWRRSRGSERGAGWRQGRSRAGKGGSLGGVAVG